MSALAAVLLLAQAPSQGGAQWERVHEGANATVYVDPASIRRTGDRVGMRQRTEFRATDPDGMRSLVFSATIDCAARTYIMHRMEGYREDGSLIRAFDLPAGDSAAELALGANDATAQALYRRSCERTEP